MPKRRTAPTLPIHFAVVTALQKAVEAASSDPEIVETMKKIGLEVGYTPPSYVPKLIVDGTKLHFDIIRATKTKFLD